MELLLKRRIFTEYSTVGDLFVGGAFVCHILEDKDRDLYADQAVETINRFKVHGKTAIPYGCYKVVITYSPRFKQQMPLLCDVPGYEGVRIHPGNKAEDTEGCLIPGMKMGEDLVYESRKAYKEILSLLAYAFQKGESVTIKILKQGT